ncbi:MAG: hypothetical protein IPM54_02270 [Polyangiaceae bacterium]|nr:hypothetical protein [Polyangiaceae bacterium]
MKALPLVTACVMSVLTMASFAAADDRDFRISKEGRRFRVQFDPESRIRVGVAGTLARTTETSIGASVELHAGIGFRRRRSWGEGPERIEWQIDNRFLTGWVAPTVQPFGNMPAFDAVLYALSAHRHDLAPRIVLPSSPPASIPFPFDVGLDSEFGRVTVTRVSPVGASDREPVAFMRVGVAHATAFIDPLRSNNPGRSIEIGVGVRYDIDLFGARTGTGAPDSLAAPRVVHRIAPGTAGSLRLRFESLDGLWVMDARGEVVPHWTSEGKWAVGALGQTRIERTLIAINDEPIAAFFDAGWRLVPASLELAALHDVRVSLGVSLGLDLTPDVRVVHREPRGR